MKSYSTVLIAATVSVLGASSAWACSPPEGEVPPISPRPAEGFEVPVDGHLFIEEERDEDVMSRWWSVDDWQPTSGLVHPDGTAVEWEVEVSEFSSEVSQIRPVNGWQLGDYSATADDATLVVYTVVDVVDEDPPELEIVGWRGASYHPYPPAPCSSVTGDPPGVELELGPISESFVLAYELVDEDGEVVEYGAKFFSDPGAITTFLPAATGTAGELRLEAVDLSGNRVSVSTEDVVACDGCSGSLSANPSKSVWAASVQRLAERDRESIEDLRRLNVNPRGVPPIALEAVADLEAAEGPSEIRRSDQERSALVTASLQGFDLGSAAGMAESALGELDVDEAIRFEVGGQSREMEASLQSLQFALLLAIFLVYVIMASQFESVIQPLVILFALPLAVVGMSAGLLATATPVSVVVLIGAIVLAGVVVNNAIVLVDYANQLRDRGLDAIEAVSKAGQVRLRPIIISTLTTVLGLLPMAFGGGEGSEIRQPLALTIIAGLSSSTLLTLLVVPVLYGLVARMRRT